MKFAHIAAAFVVAVTIASPAPAQQRAAAALTRAEQLDIMAEFLVPAAPVLPVGHALCDTAYRTQLSHESELAEVEKTLPDMTDRMVRAASAYCDVEMKKILDARQEAVRAHMANAVSPADLARLARLFAASARETRDLKVEVRPGDTLEDIVARLPGEPLANAQLKTAQIAFARTPGGVALLNTLYAYQQSLRPLLAQDQQAFMAVANRSIEMARHEANAYAAEKGILPLLVDPAASRSGTPPAPAPGVHPARLSGSSVYIYSFLTVREDEYTPKVLDRFDADLTARLDALNIASTIFRYQSPKRDDPTDDVDAKPKPAGLESVEIPVGKAIAANFIPERMSRARYRLIIFPDNFTVSGVWRFYDIRFDLYDCATEQRLLDYAYSGKHMVMLRDSENADARSKKILDRVFAEIKAKGLL